MTEDDAKKKVCPHAHGFAASEGTRNEWGTERRGELPLGRCIGSDCMAWRWTNRKLGHDLDYQISRSRQEGLKSWEAFNRETPLDGHCGLTGASS